MNGPALREIADLGYGFGELEYNGGVILCVVPLLITHHASVQLPSLIVLTALSFVEMVALSGENVVRDLDWGFCAVWAEFVDVGIWYPVGVPACVCIATERAIEVDAGVASGHERAVDGDLVEVDTETVVLGIAVEECSELEEHVWGGFDSGDHATGREGKLFDVPVVILGVLVQHELSKFVHGELASRPDFGYIKGVESELGWVSFLGLHHLDVCGPSDLFPLLNGFPKISLGIIRILA